MSLQQQSSSGLDSFQLLQRQCFHDARFVGEKVQQSCEVFVDVAATSHGAQNNERIRGTRMAFPSYEIVHDA
jgi:hypothetical protein